MIKLKFELVPLLFILGTMLLVSESAFARRMDYRQKRQVNRIREGKKSGELTRREARHLVTEQKRIHRVERRMANDGNLSPQEKAKIEKMQDNSSGHIRDQKHDAQSN